MVFLFEVFQEHYTLLIAPCRSDASVKPISHIFYMHFVSDALSFQYSVIVQLYLLELVLLHSVLTKENLWLRV